ncbi:galactokinase [Actinophytocola sp.]|uniref:galactokinase n=1 Tax=Actinophytocola sp. TaxID=1872138 RepID=UPI002ED0F431
MTSANDRDGVAPRPDSRTGTSQAVPTALGTEPVTPTAVVAALPQPAAPDAETARHTQPVAMNTEAAAGPRQPAAGQAEPATAPGQTTDAQGVAAHAAAEFRALHGRAPDGVWSAPGRVNLIGEHTDYNDGFVLPFALPYRIAVAAATRSDGMLSVTTVGDDGRPQQAEPVRIADLSPGSVSGWAAYPSGVAWVLNTEGFGGGADLVVAGDVPAGAGLSSSHALQCATALALLGLAGVEMDEPDAPSRATVAKWVQRSENDFVGVPTGLLDQTASLSCVRDHVLFLDVRSGEMEQVPFDTSSAGLAVLVIDTKAKHSHNDSGYRERRAGCERAAALLGVPALRDITDAGLADALAALPDELRPLVKHVVTENARVIHTVEHLRAGRIADIGDPLTASHISMRDDYRISCLELDVAVDTALAAGALGARMTGGGFGGSAIALVPSDAVSSVGQQVEAAFAARGLTAPGLFTAVPSPGAGRDS